MWSVVVFESYLVLFVLIIADSPVTLFHITVNLALGWKHHPSVYIKVTMLEKTLVKNSSSSTTLFLGSYIDSPWGYFLAGCLLLISIYGSSWVWAWFFPFFGGWGWGLDIELQENENIFILPICIQQMFIKFPGIPCQMI